MTGLSFQNRTYASETSKHRSLVQEYCTGYGVDVGFGGDPVHQAAIRMDLPEPYAHTGELPVQLGGDCRNLIWFRDGVLDFVYSSHVLEDFGEDETGSILREWTRVLRVGGHLVLLLPDQARYATYCRASGLEPNPHHSIERFSLEYVRDTAARMEELDCIAEHPDVGDYSFVVVFRKVRSSAPQAEQLERLSTRLGTVLQERDRLRVELRGHRARLEAIERDVLVRAVRKLRRMLRLPARVG